MYDVTSDCLTLMQQELTIHGDYQLNFCIQIAKSDADIAYYPDFLSADQVEPCFNLLQGDFANVRRDVVTFNCPSI